jgi:DNA-binding NarL/FixJ family response regulator
MSSAPVRQRTLRVAVRSDRRLFRDALAACLRAELDYDVVGHAADLDDLRVLCQLRRPEVILIDLCGGIADALTRLRACVELARVVIVYDALSPAELAALWRLGVDTLVPCSHGLEALLVVLQRYREDLDARDSRVPGSGLTEREREIITLVSAGHTVDRIAELLEISASAVANAKRRIYNKLDVAGQTQAVARAAALGIVTRPIVRLAHAMPELTARECDILRSIATGHTVRQTARQLGIAEKTVENTQGHLFRKLGARNRAGALSAAHALGLLELVTRGPATTPVAAPAAPGPGTAALPARVPAAHHRPPVDSGLKVAAV